MPLVLLLPQGSPSSSLSPAEINFSGSKGTGTTRCWASNTSSKLEHFACGPLQYGLHEHLTTAVVYNFPRLKSLHISPATDTPPFHSAYEPLTLLTGLTSLDVPVKSEQKAAHIEALSTLRELLLEPWIRSHMLSHVRCCCRLQGRFGSVSGQLAVRYYNAMQGTNTECAR